MSSEWEQMERLYAERGMGRTIGFGEHPAVLVVDFIKSFTNPEHVLGSNLDSELVQVRRLLDSARAAAVPIFYTTVYYDEAGLADSGIWGLKATSVLELRAGTPDVELDPRLGYLDDEAIVVKKYASAFFGTDLASRLNARRIDTLLVAGATTSGCVRASVVDGMQYGFRVAVVREAVGDRVALAHRQSLFDLESKYADVVGIEQALAYLAALGSATAAPSAPAT
jgi:nicotinamidase-related amidase